MGLRLIVVAACALVGCRTAKGDPVDVAHGRVEQALTRGLDASSDVGPAELAVRYNPAACECPPYEVFAYGRWMRAFIDGDSPSVSALQGADTLATARLVGVVEAPRVAENGVMYPVVKLAQ